MAAADLRHDVETAKTHGWYCSLNEHNNYRFWQLTYLPKIVCEPENPTSTTRTEAVRRARERYVAVSDDDPALQVLQAMEKCIPAHESVFGVSKMALVSPRWPIESKT